MGSSSGSPYDAAKVDEPDAGEARSPPAVALLFLDTGRTGMRMRGYGDQERVIACIQFAV
jgi:hypothetical protein